MKRLIIALFLAMIFLCGCNQKPTDEAQTVIKFSSWGSRTEYNILKQVISDYEKANPDVKVEFIHVPENYFRKLHLLYASKTEPDVIFVNNIYAPLYIKAGLFEDLSGKFDEGEYYQSALDCFKYDDKLYAIPRDISSLVLYINKDLIKNPQKITDIYTLEAEAKKATKNGVFGLNYEENPLFWNTYLGYFDGGILSDDGKRIIFGETGSIKGLQLYADMINKDKSIPHKWDMAAMTSAQMFIGEKTAIYLSGRWLVPKFNETVKFDWDVIPFPQTKTSKTLVDASGWAISKSSKHKEKAIDLVKYLSSEEVSEKFTETGLITPARKKIAESEIFLNPNKKPRNSRAFLDALNQSKPTPVNENYLKITDEITKNLENVFNGKKQASEVVDQKFVEKLQKHCN